MYSIWWAVMISCQPRKCKCTGGPWSWLQVCQCYTTWQWWSSTLIHFLDLHVVYQEAQEGKNAYKSIISWTWSLYITAYIVDFKPFQWSICLCIRESESSHQKNSAHNEFWHAFWGRYTAEDYIRSMELPEILNILNLGSQWPWKCGKRFQGP